MIIVLGIIAILILISVIYLQKFMRDMAAVENELIKELREIRNCLIKINEKQRI